MSSSRSSRTWFSAQQKEINCTASIYVYVIPVNIAKYIQISFCETPHHHCAMHYSPSPQWLPSLYACKSFTRIWELNGERGRGETLSFALVSSYLICLDNFWMLTFRGQLPFIYASVNVKISAAKWFFYISSLTWHYQYTGSRKLMVRTVKLHVYINIY